jgi:hypothetical protein
MTKFEVGRTYSTRSVCDHNCIFSYTVTRRTDKTVWLTTKRGQGSQAARRPRIPRRKRSDLPGGQILDVPRFIR